MKTEDKKLLREGNDKFRQQWLTNTKHVIVFTRGVQSLDYLEREHLVDEIRFGVKFNKETNDPYEEHDFFAVKVNGIEYFGKIDYYDDKLEFGFDFDDYPAKQPTRVMTIMRADEY